MEVTIRKPPCFETFTEGTVEEVLVVFLGLTTCEIGGLRPCRSWTAEDRLLKKLAWVATSQTLDLPWLGSSIQGPEQGARFAEETEYPRKDLVVGGISLDDGNNSHKFRHKSEE